MEKGVNLEKLRLTAHSKLFRHIVNLERVNFEYINSNQINPFYLFYLFFLGSNKPVEGESLGAVDLILKNK